MNNKLGIHSITIYYDSLPKSREGGGSSMYGYGNWCVRFGHDYQNPWRFPSFDRAVRFVQKQEKVMVRDSSPTSSVPES